MDALQIFNVELPKALEKHEKRAKEFGGKFQLIISDVGEWHVNLAEASCKPGNEKADCTIQISGKDFEKLVQDPKKNVMSMFLFGKLKVTGNQMLAMKLHKVIEMMKT